MAHKPRTARPHPLAIPCPAGTGRDLLSQVSVLRHHAPDAADYVLGATDASCSPAGCEVGSRGIVLALEHEGRGGQLRQRRVPQIAFGSQIGILFQVFSVTPGYCRSLPNNVRYPPGRFCDKMSRFIPMGLGRMIDLEAQARTSLAAAFNKFGRDYVAQELDTTIRTLERYESGSIPRPRLLIRALNDLVRCAEAAPGHTSSFTFVDLFAGIGGTRLGFERAGGRCVFTCEYDRFCQTTYRDNFTIDHEIVGDIRSITKPEEQIPDHDVLVAGFPCQPFSIAGVSKKRSLGRADGFACEAQGTLFFDIARILRDKRPLAFLLENVKNLQSHDRGRTFQVIQKTLEKDLKYNVEYKVIDAQHFVPQHRERIFMVGFREPTAFSWDDLELPDLASAPRMKAVLHPEDGSEKADGKYTVGKLARVHRKYTLSTHLWTYLQKYADAHKAKGNGFGYGLVHPDEVARTLSARYYKDGSEILVSRGKRANPRRLTPRECARLMGFDDSFKIPVSDTQAYKQFGNSVVVPVVEAVAKAMVPHLLALKRNLEESEQQLAMVV